MKKTGGRSEKNRGQIPVYAYIRENWDLTPVFSPVFSRAGLSIANESLVPMKTLYSMCTYHSPP